MKKYKVAVIGLRMGHEWAKAVFNNPKTELSMVYDKNFDRNERIDHKFYNENTKVLNDESEIYNSKPDIIVVASPDHIHAEQSIRGLESGSHVICEKPLAPTIADCRKIISTVEKTGKFFMTGQVGRYAPGFVIAKKLLDEGRIGRLAFIESEYAHDYSHATGFGGWRNDPNIKREGIIGGGCHAMDLVRWMAGNPVEIFCYANNLLLENWPTNDSAIIAAKLPEGVIGKVFVSVGVKRPYTMRTVICGTKGTIICDNTSPQIQIFEDQFRLQTGNVFTNIPVNVASHNVSSEVAEFVECLEKNQKPPTDVYEGTKTVAFGEAAIISAREGRPVKISDIY